MKQESESAAVTGTDRRLLLKATAAGIGAALVAAFFNNINWEQVLARMEALRLSAA